jgi:hypothetical protein
MHTYRKFALKQAFHVKFFSWTKVTVVSYPPQKVYMKVSFFIGKVYWFPTCVRTS